jgi:BirA family transcriptional regulator, biotin operon repressor / biotin---[acetyl-CoA-carboxylase] ligase
MSLAGVAEALWQQLEPLLPGLSVEVLPSCGSTNTMLLERARAGELSPCLLVAQTQTQGRGRLGRPWQSVPGSSLTFSLALPMAPKEWPGLSLAVGVVLAQALDTSGHNILLKWPNDLWLRLGDEPGRKLAGILIETVSVGAQRVVVIGIGINVRPQPDEGLAHGLGCVQEIDAGATVATVLETVAAALVQGLRRFEGQGFAPFMAAYAQRDLLRGRAVTTSLASVPEGIAEGVDEQGALLVRAAQLHHVSSGEVSVRLAAPESGVKAELSSGAKAA